MVSGVLCSGSGSAAGALCNCSQSNGLSVRSVGSSPMSLLERFSGISSSDDGDGESSNSSYIPKVPFHVIMVVQGLSRFVGEARDSSLAFVTTSKNQSQSFNSCSFDYSITGEPKGF